MVGDRNGRVFVMGGRKGTDAGGYTYFDDVWALLGSGFFPTHDDSTHRWSRTQVIADPVNGVPAPRARFAATWAGIDNSPSGRRTRLHHHSPYTTDSIVVYLHGGIDSNNNPLGDLWRGWRRDGSGYYEWVWQKLRDDPSTARYGHTMAYDPGPSGGLAYPDHARLLMFGGRVGPSTLANNNLLACRIATWSEIQQGWYPPAMTAGPYGTPSVREGHVAVMDPDRLLNRRRMLVFGGQDAGGAPVDTALWYLARPDLALADTVYQWARTPRIGGPTGRTRATAGYFKDASSLVLFGGDTNGSAAGGYTNEVWQVQLHPAVPAYGTWTQPYLRDFLAPDAPASAGMGSYVAPDGVPSRHLEALSASGSSGPGAGCSTTLNGQWTTLTTQDSASARAMALYPQLYVLPDNRVFHAGPAPRENAAHPYRRFFNLTSRQWADSTAQSHYDALVFGSSVMYGPGKVLRAGSHGEGEDFNGSERTETINIATGTLPGWQLYVPSPGLGRFEMIKRTNHNLTALPTGDVLVTGGRRIGSDSASAARLPQLWDVSIGAWITSEGTPDTLISDPKPRNYHSAAILLPDARVLTSGGEGRLNDSKFTASIYEPPYLFRGNTEDYAARPGLQDGPEKLPYNRTLTFTLTDSNLVSNVTSVALIRPGSATHGFDQNQRFVPLGFSWADAPKRLLIQSPAGGSYAPPGEYMLFVVGNMAADATRVPSIAKWVQLPTTSTAMRDSLDVVAPRGGSWLALSDVSPCNTFADLHLGWNAPADDDLITASGPAASYNLRYKQNSDPNPNFNSWTAVATGQPSLPLASETVVLSGLSSAVWYRFQLKAVGDNADTSLISNALVAKPQYCEEGGAGGSGGGGGGSSAQRAGAGSSSLGPSGSQGNENTLFPGSIPGATSVDVLPFAAPPRLLGGARSVYIRQGASRGLSLDRVRLLAVDHPEGTEVAATTDGRFVSGFRVPATGVADATGRDLSVEATGLAPEPLYADSGTTLSISLPTGQGGPERLLLLETSAAGGAAAGIAVESMDASGAWREAAMVHPRQRWSTLAIPLANGSAARLTFRGAHAVRFIGLLDEPTAVSTQSAPLLAGTSTTGTDWTDESRSSDGVSAIVPSRDTLSLLFEDLPKQEGTARSWYLALEGVPVTASVAAFMAGRAHEERATVTAFRLHPNIPNPFQRSTLIGFDLPSGGIASLEVFDTQGRRIWTHRGRYEPGRHSVAWDLRDRSGRIARPGIYSYRLSAAGDVAVRKMVVIP